MIEIIYLNENYLVKNCVLVAEEKYATKAPGHEDSQSLSRYSDLHLIP